MLSGMQPTGILHLGNLEGALRNWVRLQEEYDSYFCIVDWHSLTTLAETPELIKKQTLDVAIDWLAAGLNPEKCTVFIQSHVPQHAELHLLLSMITPVPWLERVPTYKEKKENLNIESASYGLLGYPVLQAADIMIYKADVVPVGKDQLPHLELTREITRRFNHLYGEVFPECEALLTEAAVVPGTDGRKMSKSYDNAIYIQDSAEETAKKIKTMFTDPLKLRMGDPGRPEVCPVFALHEIYSPKDQVAWIDEHCRAGDLGCVQCKKMLTENLNEKLRPLRERRQMYADDPAQIEKILEEGAAKAREVAEETMREVRKAMMLP
ncbi:MAG: tryptophan--tRNA ligase [Armatimonadetes bacterium]|nr:tryptophan--tRNA ligase [Armatimonadota bacterium]